AGLRPRAPRKSSQARSDPYDFATRHGTCFVKSCPESEIDASRFARKIAAPARFSEESVYETVSSRSDGAGGRAGHVRRRTCSTIQCSEREFGEHQRIG